MRLYPGALLVVPAVLLSVAVHAAADNRQQWTPCKHAQYKAQQFGDGVVLVAYGTHPTGGYRAKLRRLPIEIYPPQFECLEQAPGGFSAQVITPFAEMAYFESSGAVKSVLVHDGHGEHLVKVTPGGSTPGQSDQDGAYLTPDGKLAARLVLKDAQSGFAGVTGSFWTIEPDGSWTRKTFLNEMIREPDRSGKLSRIQLRRLATVLHANRLLELPGQIGDQVAVNPKVVTLEFGDAVSQFVSPGGSPLPRANPRNRNQSDADRFVLIVKAIQKLVRAS